MVKIVGSINRLPTLSESENANLDINEENTSGDNLNKLLASKSLKLLWMKL